MLPIVVILTSFVTVSFGLLLFFPFSCSLHEQGKLLQPPLLPNSCNETCGKLHVPFPFYVNTSCVSISSAFHLSCSNSSALLLKIGSESYPVLEFFPDGLLVDFPDTSSCRQYNDLNSFGESFEGNDYFGVSFDNVIGLYDCEDSSLCKADCETIDLPGCDGSGDGSLGCCYPLSDHSIWHIGEGFSKFSQFGCRGFSSWAVLRGSNSGKRGVKLEWAIPRNSSKEVCARSADMANATSIEGGVRCVCQDGYVGDGFANGTGCLQSCIKNGQEAYGSDCYIKRYDQRKMVIIAGILGPVLIVASLVALFYLLRKSEKPEMFDTEQVYYHNISFRKGCRTRLFSHHELEEATNGFGEGQKLMHGSNGTMFAGVLGDGSHIAVHKLKCENEKDIVQVLSQIEVLSTIVHRNMACLIGCCIDSSYTPLVVYEYPANGTLEEHLHQSKGQKLSLEWYKRLTIAAETASIVALLHYENSPPIFHHNLKSSCIFLDDDFSVKIAGFGLFSSDFNYDSHLHKNRECLPFCRNDVYDMGVVLLEIISGSNHLDSPTLALKKIQAGKLEEIVDPLLYYHEQPHYRHEQIQIIADLATRCMLFGADGKLGMIDVARELVHMTKESPDGGNMRGPALEETFSNSSLLQMISMSPDSMNVP
ncbi:probably inactive receptor-like protein kinase At2g46850 [Gastrolobium bilobum]|uniref:probably inactive receptor-like protein kinase At2g46850 n=1 Tax=Gastrolobium bilobum TaxID=150636 RepID=UPI002AB1ABC9|nr:probably inactive receptor-like protein kinase At2g46850 [Gastrolobium bilobum]